MKKYLAFDLEIAKSIPEGTVDWRAYAPLGVSCAATWATGEPDVQLWYHGMGENKQGEPEAGGMSEAEANRLLNYLIEKQAEGFTLLTWNGVGFDIPVLEFETKRLDDCKRLAWESVDMMLHFHHLKGYPLGLETACRGMGVPGKLDGMHGDLAPLWWAESVEKRRDVLLYVAQDVRATTNICLAVEGRGAIQWVSKTGRPQIQLIREWKTVREADQIPLPDVSWMTAPMKREQMTGWLKTI